MVNLKIKVVPGAARDEISGWLGDTLKLQVAAPPAKGRANAAVVKLLARVLATPKHCVRIVAGAGGRRKLVRINDISPEEVTVRIGDLLRGG